MPAGPGIWNSWCVMDREGMEFCRAGALPVIFSSKLIVKLLVRTYVNKVVILLLTLLHWTDKRSNEGTSCVGDLSYGLREHWGPRRWRFRSGTYLKNSESFLIGNAFGFRFSRDSVRLLVCRHADVHGHPVGVLSFLSGIPSGIRLMARCAYTPV